MKISLLIDHALLCFREGKAQVLNIIYKNNDFSAALNIKNAIRIFGERAYAY